MWDKIQNDPLFMQQLNGWLTVQWIGHFPVVICLYFLAPKVWVQVSLLYLALVSIYANVAGHLSAWQAARVEVAQAAEASRREAEDIPLAVAEKLIEHTTVEPACDPEV